jgi:hypothetical protein
MEWKEQLVVPEEVNSRNCFNCGNYSVCTIRVGLPKNDIVNAENETPFRFPEGITPPMPCGGSAWKAMDDNEKTNSLVKRPNETWAAFMARKKALAPRLTELPS